MNNRLFIVAVGAMILYAGTGCKSTQIASQWRDRDITIDGDRKEWSGLMQYSEDSKVGIGVVNDDKYLYLCLTSEDRMTASQILMSGLTVLFENKKRKDSRFGIQFPLGMKLSGPPTMEHNNEEESESAAMTARMQASLQKLALIGPGENDTVPMSTMMAESLGVVVSLKPSREHCVYELKVPLDPDSLCTYAIGAGTDTVLKITLETGKMSRPSGGPPGGGGRGGPPGGGMGGGGGMGPQGGGMGGGGMGPMDGGIGRGGMGGGGGGMGGMGGGGMGPQGGGMGGGGPSMPKQFKMEFSILLAKK